ncbi:MAG: hypothetical protein DKM50_02500 [Candidatus Margulisiibacteriota bacterium]|nr:MAG: hypothetical protein DKM50_02500 [Candidatus Margulisiibacteriota bacterium]HAR62533.1 hypothetical protein [Candidatus Margulisiibacteriota bacterium]HCT86305.1 hypothetical protein [Candidatus Margulisiibacteriota bacterium]HCY38102.1 hypothetical protein [Candidatus Margulisiibacteriota bacterium]
MLHSYVHQKGVQILSVGEPPLSTRREQRPNSQRAMWRVCFLQFWRKQSCFWFAALIKEWYSNNHRERYNEEGLNQLGTYVVRFSNEQVITDIDSVINSIKRLILTS